MKVLKNKRKNYTVELEIEEDNQSLIEECMENAFKKVRKHANIQGFRKGKVPRNIFEKNYGKGPIIEEALQDILDKIYRAAIESEGLKVVDYPKNVDIKKYEDGEPVRFTCEVDVEPEFKLGKYKGYKLKKDPTEVTEDEINQNLDQIRDQYADYNEDENATAEDSDIIQFDMNSSIEGEPFETWTRQNTGARIGAGIYGPEFDSALIGLKKDEKKSVEITYPEDFETDGVAGKTLKIDIEVKSIRKKTLPELTDELVKKATQDKFTTVDAYKADIKHSLGHQKQDQAENKLKDDLMKEIISNTKIEIPPAMTDAQVNNQLRHFESQLKSSGLNFDQYLKISGKGLEEMKEELKPNAEEVVKAQLIIEAIIEKEKIEVDDEDIQAEIDKWNDPKIKTIEELKAVQPDLEPMKKSLVRLKAETWLQSQSKIS